MKSEKIESLDRRIKNAKANADTISSNAMAVLIDDFNTAVSDEGAKSIANAHSA